MIPAYIMFQFASESSARWKAGITIGLGLAVAYLAEGVVWMAKRQGRPCGHCGQKTQMKALFGMILTDNYETKGREA